MTTSLLQNSFQTTDTIVRPLRWARIVFILLLVSLLGSCSTVRLGYSNADTLVYWWLDGYVDFHSSQKVKVKRDIAQLLSWHRSTQLPQYAQTLTQMQTTLAANPGPAEIEAVYRQVEQLSQVILLKAVPELTDLALTMNESQKVYLTRKFEKNNEDFREKYINRTPEKQAKERIKKIEKQTDEWLGSVTREQEAIIARHVEKHPANYANWLDDSIMRQRIVLQVVTQIQNEKPNREAAQALVQRAIMAAYEPAEQADRRTQTDASRAATQQLVSIILRSATAEQKTHARNKLQDWIDDCRYLIAKK
ncbi:hypothetical protein H8K35_10660 [Undibacterium sp. LX40W]|uniref:Lipoprotein n=1 Tax=Undibacterium nitidum TaxID=2762298 RepID=A0A923KU44_9BURK|nr:MULTISPECIES: DUF6279 family lipoprotein [Undibacterium]MBC3881882.1 hypothetical protein [Undibacterium nitidum]MBC3892121.1 hypothetical protein [Undibacterium sp. LX40W]